MDYTQPASSSYRRQSRRNRFRRLQDADLGLDPIRDIQVLCPMNRVGVGARSLNIELQSALNPAGDRQVERFGWTFAPVDKVMQIENDYDKEVYNGDNRPIGATVFATPEEFVRAPVSRLPSTWARVAVLDVDSSRIGITWAAHDRTADVAYVYDCVVTPRSDLSLLAATLGDRGAWIPVVMDAEARKRAKPEGLRIAERVNESGWTSTASTPTPARWRGDSQTAVYGAPAGSRSP